MESKKLTNPFAADVAPSQNPFVGFGNPFARAVAASDHVPEDAPEGTYTYAIVKSGPELAADECETSDLAIEIRILWDTSVLHVAHLSPVRSFYLGEEEKQNLACDFFVPSEKLGTTRAPLVLCDRGAASVVVLPGATGTVELPGRPRMSLASALSAGLAEPCAEAQGAHRIALPLGAKARIEQKGLVFEVGAVNAGRKVAGTSFDTKALPGQGVSLAAHLGLLGALAFFMPPMGATDGTTVTGEQVATLKQYIAATAEREPEQREENVVDAANDGAEGGQGTRAIGEEGAAGSQVSRATNHRFGIQGPAENRDPHIAKAEALRDAATFGMIGLINAGAGGDPDAPTAPWGGADSLGNDPMSAKGNMWGADIGEAGGAGGLGLSGIGEGGNGRGEGIGLGYIGTIGHGACYGGNCGDGMGFGKSGGHLRPGHKTSAPRVMIGNTVVGGHLPPEVIQRIVRQNFGRFRLCYENGLRSSPNLAGRVAVRFVIGRDGAVSSVGNGGSDMPDPGVVSCVVRQFYGLSFPQPESGIVTVTYPIMFSPGAS